MSGLLFPVVRGLGSVVPGPLAAAFAWLPICSFSGFLLRKPSFHLVYQRLHLLYDSRSVLSQTFSDCRENEIELDRQANQVGELARGCQGNIEEILRGAPGISFHDVAGHGNSRLADLQSNADSSRGKFLVCL
jgi:hypothetical protein